MPRLKARTPQGLPTTVSATGQLPCVLARAYRPESLPCDSPNILRKPMHESCVSVAYMPVVTHSTRTYRSHFPSRTTSSCTSPGHIKGIKRPQSPRNLETSHPSPFPHPTPNSDTTHNDDVACIFTSSYIHRLYIGHHSQARGSVYTTCRARPAPARPTPVPETGEEDGQAGSETRQESTARRPDTGHEYTTRLPDSGIMIHFGGHLSWVQPTWVIIERTIFYIVWSICIGLLTIWIPFFAVCLFKVLRSLL